MFFGMGQRQEQRAALAFSMGSHTKDSCSLSRASLHPPLILSHPLDLVQISRWVSPEPQAGTHMFLGAGEALEIMKGHERIWLGETTHGAKSRAEHPPGAHMGWLSRRGAAMLPAAA